MTISLLVSVGIIIFLFGLFIPVIGIFARAGSEDVWVENGILYLDYGGGVRTRDLKDVTSMVIERGTFTSKVYIKLYFGNFDSEVLTGFEGIEYVCDKIESYIPRDRISGYR